MTTLDALLLCDAAARDAQSGKWTLTGVFDAVWAPQFPAVHQMMDVYFRVIEGQTPDPAWDERIGQVSRKFRELKEKAANWMGGRPASTAPFTAPGGPVA